MNPEYLKEVKIRVLNFVRTNRGFSEHKISQMLSVPLNVIRQAVFELKQEELLDPNFPSLRLGRKRVG